jgi:hypothetical protein
MCRLGGFEEMVRWGRFPQGNGGALRAETRRGQPAVHEITTCTRYAREHFKMHSNTLL